MVSSETDIANLALGHLGESAIVSLAEDSKASRACALHYSTTRDGLLRSHRWNFAVARAELSELEDAPIFGWGHQFELPDDCLRVIEFNDTAIGDYTSEQFDIEGRRLLTDSSTVQIVYIRRMEDVTDWDSLFVEAMALKLAIKLTESIRGTTGKTAELTMAYTNLIAPLARRIDANEGRRRKGGLTLNSVMLRARGGGVGDALAGGGSSRSGATGAIGPAGPTGPQGPQGPAGADGGYTGDVDGGTPWLMPVETLIQMRRGTAAAWTSANPTLASGEHGVETDTLDFKIGDGATAWTSLAYAGGGGSGDALVANPLSQFAATTSAQLAGVISDETGTGALVFASSPTLVTPALGTPASGTLTNCTFPTLNQNTTGNAATVTTNANLTGPVTSTGNATAIANGAISNAMLANGAVANLSGTNTGDNATNTQYSGLVSNATHTGDATGATALTLATVNSTTGTFGDSTNYATFTVNAKGLVTASSQTAWPTFNQSTTGSAATLTTPRAINGINFDGSAAITATAAAGTLTGATLAANVLASSLTSVGTLTGGATGAGFTVALDSSTITGTLAAARLPATAALTGSTLAQFAATTSAQLAGVLSDETGTGVAVFATSPTLVTPVLGVAALTSGTATQLALGTTTAFAYKATNTTAAAAGAQQVSPATQWIGQGWKTTATAASQEVAFQAYVLPVQGTTNPTANWLLQFSVNGGAYATAMTVFSTGDLTMPASLIATTNVTCGASNAFIASGRLRIGSDASGNTLLQNTAATDFGLLKLGGTTSSFPALKRSAATLQARLADDSGFADVTVARLISDNVVRLKGYTVATLPAGTQGDKAFVTDALAPTYIATVVGGGAIVTEVFYNGTNWICT